LNLAHLHLLFNHWPIIGAFIGFGLFLVALVSGSKDIKQVSLALFSGLALLSVPTYLSGNAAAEAIKKIPDLSQTLVDAHEGAALLAFMSLGITGIFAMWGLWQFTRSEAKGMTSAPAWNSAAVLLFAGLTVGLMTVAGTTGGDIRHPEIMSPGEMPPAIATMGAQWILSLRYFVIDYSRWVWPIIEDLHFIGLILLFASVGLLNVRMLGFLKQFPLAPLHRFIPLGVVGLVINVITGFLFFVGMPFFYVGNWIFQLKILTILLAGANLLLFHFTGAFRKWEDVGPGDDTPVLAKLVAATSLILWIAVVIIGRYIPLGESVAG
jgi:hypothetical protein